MSANIFWQNFKPDVKAPGPSSHCENPVVCYHNFSRKRDMTKGERANDSGGKGTQSRKLGEIHDDEMR